MTLTDRYVANLRGEVKPTRAVRIAVAILIAGIAAWYIIRLALVMPRYGTDFDPVRAAARLILHRQDPYALIGPDRPIYWNYRVRYPMTAIVLALPFVVVPIVAARAAFVALTSGVLAYVITARAWWPLLVFASASWWLAVGLAQWSPVMLAATVTPWLGFVVAAKPNVGLAVLAASHDRRALFMAGAGTAIVVLLSFVASPHWLPEWLEITRDTPDVRPLAMTLGGQLLLLAGFKWRRPEARLLLALAAIPINPALYEGVLLFAIPRTPVEALLLATLSWFVDPLTAMQVHPGDFYAVAARAAGRAMLVCMYVPALIMVLRRPNVGIESTKS